MLIVAAPTWVSGGQCSVEKSATLHLGVACGSPMTPGGISTRMSRGSWQSQEGGGMCWV